MKEWDKLTPDIRNQLKNKLAERLESPFIQKDKLSNMKDCYKIKLRNSGYRLVYAVIESKIVILVLAIGRREHEEVYKNAKNLL